MRGATHAGVRQQTASVRGAQADAVEWPVDVALARPCRPVGPWAYEVKLWTGVALSAVHPRRVELPVMRSRASAEGAARADEFRGPVGSTSARAKAAHEFCEGP